MSKKFKKSLALLMALVMLLGCFSVSFTALAAGEVEISVANFPDPVFREIIRKKYDKTQPYGYLSDSERKQSIISVTVLTEESIKTLKGIEFFADSLSVLRCSDIGLEELDVSALYNLTSLTCMGNKLTSLDVSKNTKLITLNCARNQLISLNVGSLQTLENLYCYINKLPAINVALLTNLTDFRCEQNELTKLDVSFNTRLTNIGCASNHLTTLDLSRNTLLGKQDSGEYDMITREAISDQTVYAPAKKSNIEISIPFAIDDPSKIVSTSIDTNEPGDGYYSGKFITYDVDKIKNGVQYVYSVNNEWVQDMEVSIDVSRNFYQVDFYYDETMTQLISRAYVDAGQSAKTPYFTAPLCKKLSSWSEDITAVTSDMNVYAIYDDAHDFDLVNFVNGVADLRCYVCAATQNLSFLDSVNSNSGDVNYHLCLDVVNDNIINAKDFAELEKMFK